MTEPYLGRIEVAPRAIESIAGLAVLESYGVVGMAPELDGRKQQKNAKIRRAVY